MTDGMAVRWMAKATQEAYLAAVQGLATFYHRSPDEISDEEVQAYLLHLMRERTRAWNTCTIVVHGLRFFSHATWKRDRPTFSIPGGRQPARLPEILSRDEVQRVMAAVLTSPSRWNTRHLPPQGSLSALPRRCTTGAQRELVMARQPGSCRR